MLLRRSKVPAEEAIERLVGLQAQVPADPYIGLFARSSGFRPREVSRSIVERTAVRLPLMRATIHLVTARDCLALRPVMQSVLARRFAASPFARDLRGMDLDDLTAVGRTLLGERPLTRPELGRRLHERFSDRPATSLAYAISFLVPVVQIPPRGLWGQAGQATWTTVEAWLGRPLPTEPGLGLDDAVLRYLASFGPSTVADIQAWSGLAGMRDPMERLRPTLRSFRDDRGRELFDVPDGPPPGPDLPAPPRFLPSYDNALLGHADRRRIIADEHRAAGIGKPTVLVDGFVRGTWSIDRGDGGATLTVRTFGRLVARHRAEVIEEAERLVSFAASEATHRRVRVIEWEGMTGPSGPGPG